MSRITAVVNNKGGVGKTHTVFHLAGVYAEKGQHVLVVDLDPQANLSSLFLSSVPAHTLFDVLMQDANIHDVVQNTTFDRIELLPAHERLERLDALLQTEGDALLRLKDALSELLETRNYDHVLLDCPPSLGLPTRNALVAATDLVIPLEADAFSVQGQERLEKVIASVQKSMNPELRVAGILISLFDGRRKVDQVYENSLRGREMPIFATKIKTSAKYKEAITAKRPITHYLPKSEQADAFRNLSSELESAYVSH